MKKKIESKKTHMPHESLVLNTKQVWNILRDFILKLATNAYLNRNLTLICSFFLFFFSFAHWHNHIEALIATINNLIAVIFLMQSFPFASDSRQLITVSHRHICMYKSNNNSSKKKIECVHELMRWLVCKILDMCVCVCTTFLILHSPIKLDRNLDLKSRNHLYHYQR